MRRGEPNRAREKAEKKTRSKPMSWGGSEYSDEETPSEVQERLQEPERQEERQKLARERSQNIPEWIHQQNGGLTSTSYSKGDYYMYTFDVNGQQIDVGIPDQLVQNHLKRSKTVAETHLTHYNSPERMTSMYNIEGSHSPVTTSANWHGHLKDSVTPRNNQTPKRDQAHLHHSKTMYKPVGKKVLPVAAVLEPADITPLYSPGYSRDPYKTPLDPANVPKFEAGGRLSEERVKLIDFGPEGWLSADEKNLILSVLQMRQLALAGAPEERGCLKPSWAAPAKAATVPHLPWKERPIPLPAALRETITALVKERLATGLYEDSASAYSSRWFVVKKKSGKLRIVHDLQQLNGVTIRNSGNPPHSEDFVEGFAGRQSYALLDIYGGYDQFPIDESFRDKTTFQTALGPKRLTRMPQGWTNSVAEYQRLMEHIFRDEIGEVMGVFIDDCGVKGPKEDYGGRKVDGQQGIRQFVWEHAVTLERILFRLEEAGLTASIEKLQAITPVAEILGIRVSAEGSKVTSAKLNKVERFPRPRNATEVRSFLGLVTYVRHWIRDFGNIAHPLRQLTKKDAVFEWTDSCESAFEALKQAVGRDILLKKIDYREGAGEIILAVDSSSVAAGGALWQNDANGRRHPVRFESITFTDVESRYSQPKLELAGVTKMLKRLRNVLWGVHFTLEVDPTSLATMLNTPEVPNAPMTRWLAFIHLFDFTVRHVPGKKHVIPDVLSRVQRTESDSEAESVGSVDFVGAVKILSPPDCHRLFTIATGSLKQYDGLWRALGEYLTTGQRPEGASAANFRKVRRMAAKHLLKDGKIMRRDAEGQHREVVLNQEEQENIFRQLHDNSGHKGRDETYLRVKQRFWWPTMERDVRRWVKECDECQKRSPLQEREKRHATISTGVMRKIHFDCVYLRQGHYLVHAKDDLSGWSEARYVRKLSSRILTRFLEEDIIARFGYFPIAVVDGGSEFRGRFQATLKKAGIRRVVSAPYHPEANGRIERGHGPLVNVLAKMSRRTGDVEAHLHRALLADRISVARTTGYSPFELLYGARPILPIDMTSGTWLTLDWDGVRSREDLLRRRIEILEGKEELVSRAAAKMLKARQASIAYHDRVNAHRIREPLRPGQLVLAINQHRLESHSGKLHPRWHGPYRVVRRLNKGSYILAELDGAVIARAYAAKRLKRYFQRGRGVEEVIAEEMDRSMWKKNDEDDENEEDQAEARSIAITQKAQERTKGSTQPKFWVEVPVKGQRRSGLHHQQ